MRIEISIRDDRVRVGLSEHLTADDLETLRTLLAAFAETEEALCVLHLRGLESIDPAGLGLVHEAVAVAGLEGRALTVQRPSCSVAQPVTLRQGAQAPGFGETAADFNA